MFNTGFKDTFTAAPAIRPLLNMGCLFDIQTGRYYKGEFGENILNGGLAPMTGIGGKNNTYKSTIAHFQSLRVLDRYCYSANSTYDTENSGTVARFEDLATHMPSLANSNFIDEGRLVLTDGTRHLGDDWFKRWQEKAASKIKSNQLATTPFLDRHGQPIRCLYPETSSIDSLSRFNISKVQEMLSNHELGDSKTNTEAMTGNKAKHQMVVQLPDLTAASMTYMLMTAHVDDEIQIDPYAPKEKKVAWLKNGLKFKYVPNQFFFLSNNLWYCFDAKPLIDRSSKLPIYPASPEQKDEKTTDLMVVTVQNFRGKYGLTGMPYELILSQSTGMLVGLTEFNYMRNLDWYGLGGSKQNFYVELCPDIALKRTNLREKIQQNAKLQRALEIQSELAQLTYIHRDKYRDLLCSPKDLFDDLKKAGYDWDELLTTRGYWTFKEDKNPTPFLSTLDLLEMRAGVYKPYWKQ